MLVRKNLMNPGTAGVLVLVRCDPDIRPDPVAGKCLEYSVVGNIDAARAAVMTAV